MDLSSPDPSNQRGSEKKSSSASPAAGTFESIMKLPQADQSVLLAQVLVSLGAQRGADLPDHLERALYEWGVTLPPRGSVRQFKTGWFELIELLRQYGDEERLMIVKCAREIRRIAPGVGIPLQVVAWFKDSDVEAEGPREFRKLLQALKEGLVPLTVSHSLTEWFADRKLRIIEARNIRLALGGRPDVLGADEAWQWIAQGKGRAHDWPIALEYGERRELLETLTWSFYRRLLTHSENFWRLSGEMRNRPGRLSLFGRFLAECFDQSALLHSTDPHTSPGQGYSASGLRLARTLSGLNQRDRVVRDNLATYGRAIELAPGLNLAALRGGWLIHHPQLNPRASGLPDSALFVANDHLSASYDLGFRVPVTRLQSPILNARYTLGQGVTPATADLAASGISAGRYSIDAAAPHLINMTSISAVFGGLVCGLPKESDLFEWERRDTHSEVWRDIRGRPHFAALLHQHGLWGTSGGRSESDRRRRRDGVLELYDRASFELANTGHELLNLLDLVLHRYGAWKGGLFGVSEPHRRRQAHQVLEEAYYYHHQVSEGIMRAHDTPVVALAHRFDRGVPAEMILDPASLVLYREGKPKGLLPPSLDHWTDDATIEWGRFVTSLLYRREPRPGDFVESDYELCLVKRVYL